MLHEPPCRARQLTQLHQASERLGNKWMRSPEHHIPWCMIINISCLYDVFLCFFFFCKSESIFFFFTSCHLLPSHCRQNKTQRTLAEHSADRIERWSRSNIRGLCILISVFSGWRRSTKKDEASFEPTFFLSTYTTSHSLSL